MTARRRSGLGQGALFTPRVEHAPQCDQRAITDGAEFYRTPAWCVADLLEYGPHALRVLLHTGAVLQDPCAGDGRIPCAVDAWRAASTDGAILPPAWQLVEKRPHTFGLIPLSILGMTKHVHADYLDESLDSTLQQWGDPDAVIMNSPFSLTIAFVEAVWRRYPLAHVASLQRQSWRGSTARADWMATHQPRIYTFGSHRSRPSFRPDRKTDGAEYEWHVWLAHQRNCNEIPGGRVLQPIFEK